MFSKRFSALLLQVFLCGQPLFPGAGAGELATPSAPTGLKAKDGNSEKDQNKGSSESANSKKDLDEKNWEDYLQLARKSYEAGRTDDADREKDLALAAADRLKSDAARAEAFLHIGELCLYLKRYENAKLLMEEGLKLKRKIPGFKTVENANALDNIAQAYARDGDLESACKFELESISTYESLHKTATRDYAIALSNHANTLRQLKKYKESEQFFARAVSTQQKVDDSHGDSEDLAKTLLNAVGLYCEMNKLPSAQRLLSRAKLIIQSKCSKEHPLYRLCLKSERVYYKKVVDSLLQKDPNPYRGEVSQAVSSLASIYETEGDLPQAAEAYKQALNIDEKILQSDSAQLQKSRENYQRCLSSIAR